MRRLTSPPRSAVFFLCFAALLATVAVHAQASPPGAPPGASRQAWAAAAALSRGIAIGIPQALGEGQGLDAGRTAAIVSRAGFRSARLAVRMPWLAPEPPDEAAVRDRLGRLDETIDAFLARGVLVVLDLRAEEPQAAVRGAGTAEARRRRLGELWRQLATRYAGRPQRLLFEVSFDVDASASEKNELLARVVKGIRGSDPRRVLVVGWADAIDLPRLSLPAGDPHLIVGVGNAEPERFTRQGVPWLPESEKWRGTSCCSPQERQLMALPLDLAKTWSADHRYPVWLAEFMSHKDIPVDLRARHARFMRQAAEERGLSWAYGDFSSDFGAYDPVAGSWRAPLLQALLGR